MTFPHLWFDLDNTLLDFDASAIQSFEQTMNEFSIPYSVQLWKDYRVVSERCWLELEQGILTIEEVKKVRFRRFLDSIHSKENPDQVNDFYLQSLSESIHYYEDTLEVLEVLKKRGHRMVIITNGLKEVQRPKLRRADLLKYFEGVVISGEVGVKKPDVQFFELADKIVHNPPKSEILVIGDNLNSDIRGGRDFGTRTCWANYAKKENTILVKPDFEVQALRDILEIV